jgi:hypothetical protein
MDSSRRRVNDHKESIQGNRGKISVTTGKEEATRTARRVIDFTRFPWPEPQHLRTMLQDKKIS